MVKKYCHFGLYTVIPKVLKCYVIKFYGSLMTGIKNLKTWSIG